MRERFQPFDGEIKKRLKHAHVLEFAGTLLGFDDYVSQ